MKKDFIVENDEEIIQDVKIIIIDPENEYKQLSENPKAILDLFEIK